MLFSLRRKAPKDSPRRCLGLSFFYWKMHTHGSKGVAVLARLAQATSINWEAIYTLLKHSAKINRITMQCCALQGNAVREVYATGKAAPAGTRRAPCKRPPARYPRKWRRLTDHASTASVDAVFHSRHRTAASRTNGQAEGLRLLFVLFLSVQEKNTFFLSKGEKIFKNKKTAISPFFCFIHKPIVL